LYFAQVLGQRLGQGNKQLRTQAFACLAVPPCVRAGFTQAKRGAIAHLSRYRVLAALVSPEHLVNKHVHCSQWRVDSLAAIWTILFYQSLQLFKLEHTAQGISASLRKPTQKLLHPGLQRPNPANTDFGSIHLINSWLV
jgi:hypothetical protein